ncbi:myosin-binding protein 7 isoform X2 [Asparagus officinalis]|uniref:myosin-binding protein 7 isoform X2 n=1 Tax=Asparagus officinalis TaxID=4686 RepID=UPI00098E3A57|nr:myosin-binding protein 7 isoform X2 [Asparagus officinalis]
MLLPPPQTHEIHVGKVREAEARRDRGPRARVEVENEVSALRETLIRQQQTIEDLSEELEEERSAASTAANEAMSMILRLQREKAEIQMEFRQFKRFAEERMAHDQQELVALDDLVFKREQSVQALACEIKAYKHRLMSYGIDAIDLEPEIPETPQNFDFPDYDYPPLRCTVPGENYGDDHESSVLEKYTPTALYQLQNLETRIYEMEAEKEEFNDNEDVDEEVEEEEEDNGGDHLSDDEESARVYTIDAVHAVPTVETSNEEEAEQDVEMVREESFEDKRENVVEAGEIKKLYTRLQALEADRESMRQAIISMRTEKAQLLLLKEIAQQLCKEVTPERRIVKKPSLISNFSFVAVIKDIAKGAENMSIIVGIVLHFLEKESISKQVLIWTIKQQCWFIAPFR